jgi:hypothetical protein
MSDATFSLEHPTKWAINEDVNGWTMLWHEIHIGCRLILHFRLTRLAEAREVRIDWNLFVSSLFLVEQIFELSERSDCQLMTLRETWRFHFSRMSTPEENFSPETHWLDFSSWLITLLLYNIREIDDPSVKNEKLPNQHILAIFSEIKPLKHR